eukprot:Tbor_TRINITY_DN4031_c0_g1::TRINITY_DN4031_c0_g1_i1::g.11721::m.11721
MPSTPDVISANEAPLRGAITGDIASAQEEVVRSQIIPKPINDVLPVCFTQESDAESSNSALVKKGGPNTGMPAKSIQKPMPVAISQAPLSCCTDTYPLPPPIMNTPVFSYLEPEEEDDSPVTEQRNVTVARVIKRNKKDRLIDTVISDSGTKTPGASCDSLNTMDNNVDVRDKGKTDSVNGVSRLGDNNDTTIQDTNAIKPANKAVPDATSDKEEQYKEARNRIFTPVCEHSDVIPNEDCEDEKITTGKPNRKFRGVVDAHEHNDYARGRNPPPSSSIVNNNHHNGAVNLIPRGIGAMNGANLRTISNYSGYTNHNRGFGGDICTSNGIASNSANMSNGGQYYPQRGRGAPSGLGAGYGGPLRVSPAYDGIPLAVNGQMHPPAIQPSWGPVAGAGQLSANVRGNHRGGLSEGFIHRQSTNQDQYRPGDSPSMVSSTSVPSLGPRAVYPQQQAHQRHNRGNMRGRGSIGRGNAGGHYPPYSNDEDRVSSNTPSQFPSQPSALSGACPIDSFLTFDEGSDPCSYNNNSSKYIAPHQGQPRCPTSLHM